MSSTVLVSSVFTLSLTWVDGKLSIPTSPSIATLFKSLSLQKSNIVGVKTSRLFLSNTPFSDGVVPVNIAASPAFVTGLYTVVALLASSILDIYISGYLFFICSY